MTAQRHKDSHPPAATPAEAQCWGVREYSRQWSWRRDGGANWTNGWKTMRWRRANTHASLGSRLSLLLTPLSFIS